jgi:hypothetical protein
MTRPALSHATFSLSRCELSTLLWRLKRQNGDLAQPKSFQSQSRWYGWRRGPRALRLASIR